MSLRGYTAAARFAALAAIAGATSAHAAELRIGFINSFGHPIGREQVDAFKLGLERVGWRADGDKISGVPVKVAWCDDKSRPEEGVACAQKLLNQDRVQIVAGLLWSHVLAAAQVHVFQNRTVLLATNAGTAQLAGEGCSRYFVSASWQGDTWGEVSGRLVSADGVKSIVLVAPNYQGGKDTLAGFKRHFTGGNIRDEILFKVGQTDFQPEFSKIGALAPDAVFVFAPGPMGTSFVKQWQAAGLNKRMKLYTVFMVDHLSLKAIGNAVVGTYHVSMWDADADVPANREFVAAFQRRHGRLPSHFGAQAWDAARMIEAALKATGGAGDAVALAKALRRTTYESVRGAYSYNVNGYPVQDFFKLEVVEEGGAPRIRRAGVVARAYKDAHWEKCPTAERH